VLTVVGARPQFIKAAAVSRAFKKEARISEVFLHTGQHFDANMSDIFFDELSIPKPHHHLDIGGSTHGQNRSFNRQMPEEINRVITDHVADDEGQDTGA
jgi:UDP-N-acetylglucosamine 2-epimerase